MQKNIFRFIVSLFLSFILIGCNGGGSSSSSSSGSGPSVKMDSADGGVANGATNVSLTPNIVLQFSEPMNPATINGSTVILGTDPAPAAAKSGQKSAEKLAAAVPIGSITANPENTKFSFQPASPLQANTKYFVTVTKGAQTAKGVSVSGQFSFTTGSAPTPTVALLNPSNGQTGVGLSPTIQLQFSQAVQNVNSTNITLHAGSATGTQVALGTITPGANNTYSFSPSAQLSQQTAYYLVISSGITSVNGNSSLAPTTFNFTTGPLLSVIQNGASGGNTTGRGVTVDANGNTYVTGVTTVPFASGLTQQGTQDYFVAKYDNAGALVWAKQVGAAGGNTNGVSIVLDGSGNIYIGGVTNVGINGNPQIGTSINGFLVKYDNNGNLIWSRQIGAAGGFTGANSGVGVDSQGNVYISGQTSVGLNGQTQNGSQDYFLIKYDSTGNVIWSKQNGAAGGTTTAYSLAVDASGNSYFTGQTDVGLFGQTQIGTVDAYIAKYDASGTNVFYQQIGASGATVFGFGTALDSAGNAYVSGQTSGGLFGNTQQGTNDYFVAKYNTTGTLVWGKQVGASGGVTYAYKLAADASGNVYLTGSTNVGISGQTMPTGATTSAVIAKYDTSGNLLITSLLGGNGGSTLGLATAVDANGNTYITGNTTVGLFGQTQQGAADFYLAKYSLLP